MRFAPAAAAGLAILACARPLPPPGGERDEVAPQVIGTTPEPLAVVEPSDDAVVFQFDGTLSERGVSDALVLVSPRTGAARVERDGNVVRVRIEGGWQPGIVYRVVLLPGLQDRFQNQRRQPAELVFSTGPDIPSAAIAGLVLDRITGEPAADVIVEGSARGDTLAYLTVPDSAAFFALQYLPAGIYQVRAFRDQNRNREQDEGEAYASSSLLPLNRANDTLTTVLEVVPFDTLPPRITAVEVMDSTRLRVTTDDWLEPAAEIGLVDAELLSLPDSAALDVQLEILSAMTFDSLQAVRDSIAADSAAAAAAAADTTAADTAQARLQLPPRAPPARPAGARGGRPATRDPDAGPLPYQTFYIIVQPALQPGAEYLLRMDGLTNISGRSGGGGTADFTVPERPPPADTTGTGRRRP